MNDILTHHMPLPLEHLHICAKNLHHCFSSHFCNSAEVEVRMPLVDRNVGMCMCVCVREILFDKLFFFFFFFFTKNSGDRELLTLPKDQV